jgi:hypothetical protein
MTVRLIARTRTLQERPAYVGREATGEVLDLVHQLVRNEARTEAGVGATDVHVAIAKEVRAGLSRPLRKRGGLVDATGRGLVGAKGEYPF